MYPHCGVLRREESVDAAVCILHVTHVARWHVLARCPVGPAALVECCSSQAKPPPLPWYGATRVDRTY